MSDLQSDVAVSGGAITGTLKYVTGYTGFSVDPAEQNGYYICLHADADDGSTIVADLQGGIHPPVTLDSDGLLLARISDPEKQYLKFTATKGDVTEDRYFSLSGLVLEVQS